MRMTSRKKEILSYFEPDNLEWVTGEIGAPPFDVSGVAYLLHGMVSFDKRHQLESTRRSISSIRKLWISACSGLSDSLACNSNSL
ncbi:hypothetical protein SHBO111935_11155 [Shigella boydii]|uniref:Uncharacterized protein n=2 Tax=Shigella dysenteriae TaxID=622 RepID=A0A3P6KFE6_SHIDY|nr:hypothetical protein SDB_00171 [Shigella dysenteriae CDC 74-1112]VDG86826.1 Uncharacterised protein [Shigella dysenteriae]